MKRDWNTIRSLLLDLESDRLNQINNPNATPEHKAHALMVLDAQLAEGSKLQTQGTPSCRLTALTWKGHEFLSLARDDDRWNAAIEKTSGNATMDALCELLKNAL